MYKGLKTLGDFGRQYAETTNKYYHAGLRHSHPCDAGRRVEAGVVYQVGHRVGGHLGGRKR